MNAKQAREKTNEARKKYQEKLLKAKKQEEKDKSEGLKAFLISITKLINKAAKEGDNYINLDYELKDDYCKLLKKEGYKVEVESFTNADSDWSYSTRISW